MCTICLRRSRVIKVRTIDMSVKPLHEESLNNKLFVHCICGLVNTFISLHTSEYACILKGLDHQGVNYALSQKRTLI